MAGLVPAGRAVSVHRPSIGLTSGRRSRGPPASRPHDRDEAVVGSGPPHAQQWSAGLAGAVGGGSGTVRGSAAIPSGVRRRTSSCSAGAPTSDGRRQSISTSSPRRTTRSSGVSIGVRRTARARGAGARRYAPRAAGVCRRRWWRRRGGGRSRPPRPRSPCLTHSSAIVSVSNIVRMIAARTCATSSRICAISASIDSKRCSSRRRSPTSSRSRRS